MVTTPGQQRMRQFVGGCIDLWIRPGLAPNGAGQGRSFLESVNIAQKAV